MGASFGAVAKFATASRYQRAVECAQMSATLMTARGDQSESGEPPYVSGPTFPVRRVYA